MKRWVWFLALVTIPAAGLGEPIDSATHLNFLITEPTYSGCGDPEHAWIDSAGCADLASVPVVGEALVWVVASRIGGFPDGIGGVQFGVEHTAGVLSWTACTGGLEIPEDGWPASGYGNAVAWRDGCYVPPGENAKIGYFRVADGASGEMAIIPDPRPGKALCATCDAVIGEICGPNLGAADLALGTAPDCENLSAPPAAPTGCQATDDACDLAVSWAHDGLDVTEFRVLRGGTEIAALDGQAREYVDAAARPGISYSYAVRAFSECGSSALSNPAPGWIPAPDTASHCVASDDLCDLVRVTWQDESDDELGFKVLRNDEVVAVTGPDVTQADDTTAVPGQSYAYSVVAFGACGDGFRSNSDSGVRAPLPAPASHCVASEDMCGSVLVTWWDRSWIETGSKILRDADAIATVPRGVTRFVDSTGVPGQGYLYAVVAVGECGDAEPSNADLGIASTEPPPAASECTASQGLCHFVRVTWRDRSNDESGFKVLRDGSVIQVVEPNVWRTDDSTAVVDVNYSYSVVATSDCGDAAPTEPAQGQAGSDPPLAATDCSASNYSCESVYVWWTDQSADESGFRILRDGAEIGITRPNATQFADTTAVPDTTYEYVVVATNACGDGDPSNSDAGTRRFALPPGRPILVSPADSATCVDRRVTFLWRRVPGAVDYDLLVSSESRHWGVFGPDTMCSFDLPGGSVFDWKVRATNLCGEIGEPSETRRVHTHPDLVAPGSFRADPSHDDFWVFAWQTVEAAEHYVLSVGECEGYEDESSSIFTVIGTDTLVDMTPWMDDEGHASFRTSVAGFACADTGEAACAGYAESPVLLESFDARPADRAIVIEWRTAQEWAMRGFNLARSDDAGASFARVNEDLIPGGQGAYRYEDRDIEGNASYTYRLSEIEDDGREVVLGEATVTSAPAAFALRQNVPNPFNPRTGIVFELPAPEVVTLEIFDTAGRRIRRLVETHFVAGVHRVPWDGRDDAGRPAASGTYFARLEAGRFESVRRLVLLK